MQQNNPQLAQALEANDARKLEELVGQKVRESMKKKREEQEKMARLMNADPNDAEAQKQIEEEIKKGLIQ